MATQLEEILAMGVKEGKVPQAIVYATNRDGSFSYNYAIGLQNPGIDDAPVQEDAILMLASQSKLLTAIAVLKAHEQGLVDLDTDVAPHLPELAEKPILTGFDAEDKPVLKARTKPITLRHLVTHSSGTSYTFIPQMAKYQGLLGRDDPKVDLSATIVERYDYPLVFEPGESWIYSPGLDWAGLYVQRVTGVSLEEYMQTNLWKPLGVEGITFWPYKDVKWKDKVPQLCIRTEEGKLVPMTKPSINTHSIDCFGGHGIYATMPAYIAVLRDLLNPSTSKLLSAASIDELFRPQFTKTAVTDALASFLDVYGAVLVGSTNPAIPVNHGLGGVIVLGDDVAEGRRKKGTMFWGGLTNPFWFVDCEAGLAVTFGTQSLPSGDPGAREVVSAMEKALYQMAGIKF